MANVGERCDPQEMLKARLKEIKKLKGPQRSVPCGNPGEGDGSSV